MNYTQNENQQPLPEYILRMKEELTQLNERIQKANAAMVPENGRDGFMFDCSIRSLGDQIVYMTKYRNELLNRIVFAVENIKRSRDLNKSVLTLY